MTKRHRAQAKSVGPSRGWDDPPVMIPQWEQRCGRGHWALYTQGRMGRAKGTAPGSAAASRMFWVTGQDLQRAPQPYWQPTPLQEGAGAAPALLPSVSEPPWLKLPWGHQNMAGSCFKEMSLTEFYYGNPKLEYEHEHSRMKYLWFLTLSIA